MTNPSPGTNNLGQPLGGGSAVSEKQAELDAAKKKADAAQAKANANASKVAKTNPNVFATAAAAAPVAQPGPDRNPPFDARSTRKFDLNDGSRIDVKRGFLRQASQYLVTNPYSVYFLYNPSAISVTYQEYSASLTPNVQTDSAKQALLLAPNLQLITFALFFNRMYDVLTNPAVRTGVRVDIEALERLVGIKNGTGGLLAIPLDLYFAQDLSTVLPRPQGPFIPSSAMHFFGKITSMDVTYASFSHNMTPTTAQVNITFTQLALGTPVGTADTNFSTQGFADTTSVQDQLAQDRVDQAKAKAGK